MQTYFAGMLRYLTQCGQVSWSTYLHHTYTYRGLLPHFSTASRFARAYHVTVLEACITGYSTFQSLFVHMQGRLTHPSSTAHPHHSYHDLLTCETSLSLKAHTTSAFISRYGECSSISETPQDMTVIQASFFYQLYLQAIKINLKLLYLEQNGTSISWHSQTPKKVTRASMHLLP